MGDGMTWDAILQQWHWFAAAAGLFVVFVIVFAFYKPRSKRQPETTYVAADKRGWTLTGRIDFADPRSLEELVLQVEETRIVSSPSGIEHREIRWRKATLDEAKMVLVSYHAQRNLTMSANFIVSAPSGTKRNGNGQRDKQDVEVSDGANGQGLADVQPVPADVTGSGFSAMVGDVVAHKVSSDSGE